MSFIVCNGNTATCQECGNIFQSRPSRAKKGRGKYCSHACQWKAKRVPMADRFHKHVAPPDENGCMMWQGNVKTNRYGTIRADRRGKPLAAHRVAWELANGQPVPTDMHVLHRCDNPGCVNPAHLFLGTDLENVRDMYAKDRGGSAKLTVQKVRELREIHAQRRHTIRQLADLFNICESAVCRIIARTTWRHV